MDTSNNQSVSSHIDPATVVYNDADTELVSLVLKIQKIISATYLISNLVPQSDPLFFRIRHSAMDLTSLVMNQHNNEPTKIVDNLLKSRVLLNQIVFCIQIGHQSHYVSNMNMSIMAKNVHETVNVIVRYLDNQKDNNGVYVTESDHQNNITLSDEWFTTPKRQSFNTADTPSNDIQPASSVKTTSFETEKPTPAPIQSPVQEPVASVVPERNILSNTMTPAERRARILEVLKDNIEASIKDIAEHINGVSEKTIQRDLNQLINDGFVVKKGDKRWSSYVLVG